MIENRDIISALPQEVSLLILSKLTVNELVNCSKVSKTWNCLSSDEHLWTALYKDHFPDAKIITRKDVQNFYSNLCIKRVHSIKKLSEIIDTFFTTYESEIAKKMLVYNSASNSQSRWEYTEVYFYRGNYVRGETKLLNIEGAGGADFAKVEKLSRDSKHFFTGELLENVWGFLTRNHRVSMCRVDESIIDCDVSSIDDVARNSFIYRPHNKEHYRWRYFSFKE